MTMTKTQAEILESIAALSEAERRALLDHLVATNAGATSFRDQMTPEQRQELAEGIDQANRGDVISAEDLKNQIERRFQFSRS